MTTVRIDWGTSYLSSFIIIILNNSLLVRKSLSICMYHSKLYPLQTTRHYIVKPNVSCIVLTFLNTCNSIKLAQYPKRYLFLFSRKQLSSCRYRTSGSWLWCHSESTSSKMFIVKLESCGHCRWSTKAYTFLPCSTSVWTMTPVTWVLSLHRPCNVDTKGDMSV